MHWACKNAQSARWKLLVGFVRMHKDNKKILSTIYLHGETLDLFFRVIARIKHEKFLSGQRNFKTKVSYYISYVMYSAVKYMVCNVMKCSVTIMIMASVTFHDFPKKFQHGNFVHWWSVWLTKQGIFSFEIWPFTRWWLRSLLL